MSAVIATPSPAVDLAVKTRQQAAWSADNYAVVGNRSGNATLVLPSEYLEVVIERKGTS
jgi:hypothetical protein